MDFVVYHCGECRIDPANRLFARGGAAVALEPKAFAVILQLLGRPNSLVSRDELLDAVWGHRYVTRSTLNRVIALARRAFGDDSEVPRFIQTVHGVGYRYIGPIEEDSATLAAQRVRFAPPPAARLPARIDSLIGRDEQLKALADLFKEHRAVTVLGSGGIGKTQCALECARQIADEFADGVWFFDLAPMKGAAECLHALAAALAISIAPDDVLMQKVAATLAGRQMLLLLDNCDHIAAQVGGWLYDLLSGIDSLKVLATSQAPLNFRGEQILRMPPLALPTEGSRDERHWREIANAPAVAMLLARIQAAQPRYAFTPADAPVLADICIALDGIPLALELAAARFVLLTPQQVRERLNQRFQFLNSNSAGRDDRHRNLLALLDWSFSLLSNEEQRLLLWCGVFVQGWSVEGVLQMAVPLGHDPERAIDLFTGLVNKSLVSVVPRITPPRYRLLETVREYALQHLRASGEEIAAKEAHLAYVEHLCRESHAAILAGHMLERIERLNHEHGNIGSALQYAANAAGGRPAAMDITFHLLFYIKARGLYYEFPRWCVSALAAGSKEPTVEHGRALLCLGVGAVFTGTPIEPLRQALRIAEVHGDWWTQGCASGFYAAWLVNNNEVAEAEKYALMTEQAASRLAEPVILSLACLALGWVCMARAEYAEGLKIMRPARSLGYDLHQRHFIDMYMGLAHFGLQDFTAAAGDWVRSLNNAIQLLNPRGAAGCIEGCAYLLERLNGDAESVRLLQVAHRLRERAMSPLFRLWHVHHDGVLSRLKDRLGPAAYEEAVSEGRQLREEDAVNRVGCLLRELSGAK